MIRPRSIASPKQYSFEFVFVDEKGTPTGRVEVVRAHNREAAHKQLMQRLKARPPTPSKKAAVS